MTPNVFSAVEALKSKSSNVAIKVETFVWAPISVRTLVPSRFVLTDNPGGVLKLSGERALQMAWAVFSSVYSSVIVASNVFTL